MAFSDGTEQRPEPLVRVGVYPTPAAGDPEHVVDLARIAEDAGLDLVVVQDHPYQPAFLDGLTAATAVTASTRQLEVWPHVAALPLRLPTLLAKAIASLDLLGGGRSGAVLSAGDFPDGIVAAGGQLPTAPAAALAEAADVVRGTWAGQGVVEVHGTHHRVSGLMSGPRPAHRTPLWMTARTPEEITTVAEKADGWLVSMADVPPWELADVLAQAPAREWPLQLGYLCAPADGFLDGDWATELGDLVAEHGLSLLLLATDDPDDVEDLGAVAEAVRARSGGRGTPRAPTAGPLRAEARPAPTEWLTDVRLPADRPHVPAPADAAYTPAQQLAPADLVARHDALRAELATVHDLVDQVSQGVVDVAQARNAVNRMTMRTTAWHLGGYCEGYCRLVSNHHVDEDTSMFPHLRAAEASLGPVLDRLEEEHAVIAATLEDLDRALVAVVAGEVTDVEGVRRELAVLTDVLLSHLAYEEAELLHPLARHGSGG